MNFKDFKVAVQRQFAIMSQSQLFTVTLNKDDLWKTYLSSFPTGTNPIYKTRTEHDCQCCKQFIRNAGNIVAIQNGKLVSIWDIRVDDLSYQIVANTLAEVVKSHQIHNTFLHYENHVGTDHNHVLLEDRTQTFEHFHINLPKQCVKPKHQIDTILGEIRSIKDVFLRSLTEITLEAIDTVLDLINQNSLYRGEENKHAVSAFRELKIEFDKAENKDLHCWSVVQTVSPGVSKIRSTAIGTLLVDLSVNVDLDIAVRSFESKVAPMNYKRPTSLVTKAMVEKARQTITDLGLSSALERRFAVLEDINVNNILFADRASKKRLTDVFDEVPVKAISKKLDKIEEIQIDDFITKILPNITTMEIMPENKHISSFVSLIAPSDMTAKHLFKWDNPFSWSYNGNVADSIKERVKNAGGNIGGEVRISLSWFNHDDLDLHLVEPNGNEIYYWNRRYKSLLGGILDVDMNVQNLVNDPVENICYASKDKMVSGIYRVFVNPFRNRTTENPGFEIEIEINGQVMNLSYDKAVKQRIEVGHIIYDKSTLIGFQVIPLIPETNVSKEIWNVQTNQFQKVSVMMLSPNYWNNQVGNKHYFFMLENCINNTNARGFFNEFLISDLDQHRKVFEIVGNKMKAESTPNQMSGLGFSSTQRNSILCRVSGTFTRTIKLIF
jgi:hypothetical protein